MEKCQVDDNASSSDQISHGLASSTGENKASMQNQRDSDISTISSERAHSAKQTSLRSDVSSETRRVCNKDRKEAVADRTEVGQREHKSKAPSCYDQLKADSFSSKESGETVRLSSMDSADPKPCQSSNENSTDKKSDLIQDTSGYLCPTQSVESKNVQEPESSLTTTKSDPAAASMHSAHHRKFDLNEGTEADGSVCHHQSSLESRPSGQAAHASEPIPVVAKVGVPVGLPKKPLQFVGELGWKTSGDTSAFRPTFLRCSETEKGGCGTLKGCSSRQSLISQGIDLNIAAAADPEVPADEISVDGSSKRPKRFLLDLNCQSENDENHLKSGAPAFDLNDNPVNEDSRRSSCRTGENRQPPRSYVASDIAACSGVSVSKTISDCRRPSPYWVDLSSVRGFSHVQGQPFLVAAPAAEHVQMVVPVQSDLSFLPHGPSGLYIGKINGLPPTFYPPNPNVLPHLNNQPAAVIPQISGPVLAAYPGSVHVLESRQGLNPNAYANIRPTFVHNGSIALLESGSRGVCNPELLVPARNTLFEERMKPIEQAAFTASSAKRREPDGGWDPSQFIYKRMAPWS